MRTVLWLGCLSYLLIGIAHVALGSVLEELIAHYGLDYNKGSQLILYQFAGYLLGVLATPWLLNKIGRHQTLVLSLIALTIAESVYSLLPAWGIMLAMGPIAGIGFGVIEATIGALIIEFVTERKSSVMSRLEVFFGLGALIMPAAASLLIGIGHWEWAFPFVAGISLVTLICWWRAPIDSFEAFTNQESTAAFRKPGQYSRSMLPMLSIMLLFFAIYVGAEMSFVHFLPSILIENVGTGTSVATIGITVYWAAMVVGRLFAGVLADKIGYARYLIASGAGMLLFLSLFTLSGQLWVSFAIILLIGLAMAGMFAIALIFVNEQLPGLTERTTSLMVAAGAMGGALLPRLVGFSMDEFPLSFTYGIFIAAAGLLIVLVALAARPPESPSS